MKKKRLAALLLAVMACASVLTVGAAQANPVPAGEDASMSMNLIAPRWDNTNMITCTLGFSGTTAECTATISAVRETTKITGTLTLYRQSGTSWVKVKSWPGSSTTSILRFSEEVTVTAGYNYKLIVTASVYANGAWESVEKESAVKYCG